MRWLFVLLLWICCQAPAAFAVEGRVLKVLPQFLDKKGRSSISPSLYDRDAYQAVLRHNPAQRSALRFAVEWKTKAPETENLIIRVEIRGAPKDGPAKLTAIDSPIKPRRWFSHWTYVTLSREEYQAYGEVTAWRVSMWDGPRLLSEQKSFLW